MLTMRRRPRISVLFMAMIASQYYLHRPIALVNCYSWGAGSCDSGGAIGGYHLESYEGQSDVDVAVPKDNIRCVRTGSLTSSGIYISIGDQAVLSNSQEIKPLQYNIDYEVQIYRLTSIFRGILIRLSSSDGNTTDLTGKLYTTDPLLQLATTACATPTVAVGVTHRSAIDKDLVYARLRFDSDSASLLNSTESYKLEISVVGMNNEHGSLYAYSSYSIQVSGQVLSTNEEVVDDGLTDDNNVLVFDDDESGAQAGEKSLEDTGKYDDAPTGSDVDQSSSMIIGLTTIGGASLVALLALVIRAKVARSRILNDPL